MKHATILGLFTLVTSLVPTGLAWGTSIETQTACSFAGNNDPTTCLNMWEGEDQLFLQYQATPKGGSSFVVDFKVIVRLQDGGDDDEVESIALPLPNLTRAVYKNKLPCGKELWIQGQAGETSTGALPFYQACNN